MLISCAEGMRLGNIWVSECVSPFSWVKSWHIGMAGVEEMLFKLKKSNQLLEQGNTVSFYYKCEKKKAKNALKYELLNDLF